MGLVKEIQSKVELDKIVGDGSPAILYFWASRCEAADGRDQVFSALSTCYPHVHFLRVEAEEQPEISEQYPLSAGSHFVFLKEGKVVGTLEGADHLSLANKVAKIVGSITPRDDVAPAMLDTPSLKAVDEIKNSKGCISDNKRLEKIERDVASLVAEKERSGGALKRLEAKIDLLVSKITFPIATEELPNLAKTQQFPANSTATTQIVSPIFTLPTQTVNTMSTLVTTTTTDTILLSAPRRANAIEITMDSGESATSMSNLTEVLHFSFGNPNSQTKGVMDLYCNQVALQPHVGKECLLCVPSVPSKVTYAAFLDFCTSYVQDMLTVQILRNDGRKDCYSILIKFKEQEVAHTFQKEFNGKQFAKRISEKGDLCNVYFANNVSYTGSSEPIQSVPAKRSICHFCIERLDQGTCGIFKPICSHSFHLSCVKWSDCPVCQYSQQTGNSKCHICRATKNLWMCFVCGFVGCGRGASHARRHWEETLHGYALELETWHVWVYSQKNYLQHVIQSEHGNDGCSHGCDPRISDNKVDLIVDEYIKFLTLLRKNQQMHFEILHQKVEMETKKGLEKAIEKALGQDAELKDLEDKLKICIEAKKSADPINYNREEKYQHDRKELLRIEERMKLETEELKFHEARIEELKSLMLEANINIPELLDGAISDGMRMLPSSSQLLSIQSGSGEAKFESGIESSNTGISVIPTVGQESTTKSEEHSNQSSSSSVNKKTTRKKQNRNRRR